MSQYLCHTLCIKTREHPKSVTTQNQTTRAHPATGLIIPDQYLLQLHMTTRIKPPYNFYQFLTNIARALKSTCVASERAETSTAVKKKPCL